MSKRTTLIWWIVGLAALVPATVLGIPSAVQLLARIDQIQRAPGYGFLNDPYLASMVTLSAIAAVFAVCWLVAALVAWVCAVVNAQRLNDSQWFTVLLVGGLAAIATMPLFGLGVLILFGLMTAYLVAAPDSTASVPQPTTPVKATINKWAARGFALAGIGLIVALVTPRLTGPDQVLHGATWAALAIVSAGIAAMVLGGIVVYAAWWGALFNAQRLSDQTWFHRLLWAGIAATLTMPLLGLGAVVLAVVMIAYGRRAPDAPALVSTARTAGMPPSASGPAAAH